jgi:thiamine biosynthesis lipoprotein
MGTRFECVLAGFSCATDESHAMAAAEEVERIVREWHALLSAFDPASVVSRINAQAGRGAVRVPGELLALLERAVGYTRQTHGVFDVTLGSLMALHGFRGDDRGGWARGVGALRLEPGSGSVGLAEAGVCLDLGGIAKGFVLDLCAAELRDLGVESALVHGGTSSAIAVGARPDGEPWKVGLAPDREDGPVVELVDAAMSVSEPRGRVVEGRGHIVDPRSGESAGGVELACVFGPSAEVCEVWSTALAVDESILGDLPEAYGAHVLAGSGWVSKCGHALCA